VLDRAIGLDVVEEYIGESTWKGKAWHVMSLSAEHDAASFESDFQIVSKADRLLAVAIRLHVYAYPLTAAK